jgi:hypothetical protein
MFFHGHVFYKYRKKNPGKQIFYKIAQNCSKIRSLRSQMNKNTKKSARNGRGRQHAKNFRSLRSRTTTGEKINASDDTHISGNFFLGAPCQVADVVDPTDFATTKR